MISVPKKYLLSSILCVVIFVLGIISGKQLALSSKAGDITNRENIPALTLSAVIKRTTPYEVLPLENDRHADLVNVIRKAADEALLLFNSEYSPTNELRRINEASRYFEEALRNEINSSSSFKCEFSKNENGEVQRSGYPDLEITALGSNETFYLDPKLYEQSSENSSFRSFYFSKSSHSKINKNAVHLLLGISHDGNDGSWKFLDWKLIDLSALPLNLKQEYNAANKDLYRTERIILRSEALERSN